ncbi:MAG: recombinase family protein [Ruminococcus flavefaciens]|nr:recombinase family protein [Ruminococcus flavefaciens]
MLAEKQDYYYLRLSKEDGDVESDNAEESCSITSQRDCIKRYLHENHFSSDDFEEIVDDGYSGTSMNRPGMKRLLKLVETGKVRTIIVRDLSRFARNYLEAGHYLEFVFPAYGVRFISINDNFDSEIIGENTGGLELAIKNLLNHMYSKDISRKIKSAVDLKKLSGEYVYGTAPYGYKKGEKRNTIIIDREAADIVRTIFEWAADGVTITQIARKLNAAHIVTPSVYLASVRGKYKTQNIWTFESVRNILANRIYTGDTVPFKSHVVSVGSNKVKQIPEELQQVIPNTHEPIVSRELFYQARTVIKSIKKSKGSSHMNPFTSFLICGCCGKHLIKGKQQNKNWMCENHRYNPGSDCKKVRIREDNLKEIVLRAINVRCKLLDAKIKKMKQESNSAKSSEQILQTECQTLRKQIDKIQASKMQYYESYVNGKITKDAFIKNKKEISEQEEDMKIQLNIAERKLNELIENMSSNIVEMETENKIIEYQEINELTPQLMKELVKRIIIFPNGSIRIEWNFCNELGEVISIDDFMPKEKVG